MIVWLASYPRSGNTMVRMLLDVCFGASSREFNPLDPNKKGSVDHFMDWAPLGLGADLGLLRDTPQPHFLKTHERPMDDQPAICIVRDGRDVLVSYAHFLRSFEPCTFQGMDFEQVLKGLIRGHLGYGSWSAHLNAWRNRPGPAKTVWLRYEDILSAPIETLQRTLEGLNIDLRATGKSPLEFAELHDKWPAFFRKGRVNGWRDEMSPADELLFWELHGEMMECFGYSRDAAA